MSSTNGLSYRQLIDRKSLQLLLEQNHLVESLGLDGLEIFEESKALFNWGAIDSEAYQRSLEINDCRLTLRIHTQRDPNAIAELLKFIFSSNLQKALLAGETLERYKEINSLFQLSESICRTRFLGDVVKSILEEICKLLPCSQASLWLARNHRLEVISYERLGCQLTETQSILLYEDESALIKFLIETDAIADIFLKRQPKGFDIVNLPECWMFIPLKINDRKMGGLLLLNPLKRAFQSGDLKLASSLGAQASFSIENSMLFEEIEGVFDGVVRGLIAAVDERDSTTSGHSARIAHICERFAKQINATNTGKFKDFHFSTAELREIKYAGLLHDIGKIGVREDVLKKKNRLHPGTIEAILARLDMVEVLENTDLKGYKEVVLRSNAAYNLAREDAQLLQEMLEYKFIRPDGSQCTLLNQNEFDHLSIKHGNLIWDEIQEMRKHPAGTRKILDKIKFPKDLQNISKIAAEHHEKLDGSGYPNGLSGADILLQSQIMCIADIYEALVDAKRPYKPALSPDEALKIIELEVSEHKIDPELYKIFKENLHAIVPRHFK